MYINIWSPSVWLLFVHFPNRFVQSSQSTALLPRYLSSFGGNTLYSASTYGKEKTTERSRVSALWTVLLSARLCRACNTTASQILRVSKETSPGHPSGRRMFPLPDTQENCKGICIIVFTIQILTLDGLSAQMEILARAAFALQARLMPLPVSLGWTVFGHHFKRYWMVRKILYKQ